MKIVVVGLGYVGITLALTLADVGFSVVGSDKDKRKIEKLRKAEAPIYEPYIKQLLESTISSGNIEFFEEIPTFDENITYIISVGTPIHNETQSPMLDNYKNAATEIAKKIKKDDLIIQRSTVPVGTARNTLKKILEENSNLKASVDFQLSCAPERTLQGNALKELRELSQIIGGIDERSVKKTSSIFNKITHTIVKVSSLEAAELIKLFDNTYRDITISIANLYGKICQKLNLDAKEVIEAANYGYSRNKILFPGPGVGGGCLVKDPYLLLSSLQQTNLDLIKKSREINDSMITDTINLIKSSFEKTSKIIKNSKIFVLGFAFKGTPATDDIRFSPTLPIVDFLKKEGAIIYGYDGVVKPEDIKGLGVERISQIYEKKNYDCIILMNNNQEFRGIDFKKLNEGSKPLLIIDGWYMYDSKILDRLGIKYFALGAKNE